MTVWTKLEWELRGREGRMVLPSVPAQVRGKTDDASLDRYAGMTRSPRGESAWAGRRDITDTCGNHARTVSSTMGAMAEQLPAPCPGAMSGAWRQPAADAVATMTSRRRHAPGAASSGQAYRRMRRIRRGGRECEVGLIDGCRYVRSVGGDAAAGAAGAISPCPRMPPRAHRPVRAKHESQCGRPCACGRTPRTNCRPEHASHGPASCVRRNQ